MSDETLPVEIREQPVGAIDEIVINGCNVHIERMTNDSWFMGVEAQNGDWWQFWFGSKNRKSHVEFHHTEFTPAERSPAGKAAQKRMQRMSDETANALKSC